MQSCDSCDGLHVMSCDCRMLILQVAVGKFACQNCVVMRSGAYELFMLGSHSVSAVTLATWKQVDTHIQRPHTCVTCAHTCPSSSPTRVTSHPPSSSPTRVTSHPPSPSPTHVTSHPLSLSHTCYVTPSPSPSPTAHPPDPAGRQVPDQSPPRAGTGNGVLPGQVLRDDWWVGQWEGL